jgi:hypothetical protein
MRKLNVFVVGLSLLATASSAFAARGGRVDTTPQMGRGQQSIERVRIQLAQEHFKGQNTIFLKREIKQQNPYLNLQDMSIDKVVLVAKSKQGGGTAGLEIAGSIVDRTTIAGNPYDFHDRHRSTFTRTTLTPRGGQAQGPWQIELQGNIKIANVIVFLKEKMVRSRFLTLDMHGQELKGFETVKLKQMIKQQNPRVDLSRAEVESVIVMAKSQLGMGQVSLKVGGNVSQSEQVNGNPFEYNSSRDFTFDKITLFNPSYSSTGAWQLLFQGKIKVQKIVVKLK